RTIELSKEQEPASANVSYLTPFTKKDTLDTSFKRKRNVSDYAEFSSMYLIHLLVNPVASQRASSPINS
ncbi:MAG: hypothetical protein JWM44_2926, partial [Bacilli bacterium]|nr:hypothetical protein [Bacilli bacterium]